MNFLNLPERTKKSRAYGLTSIVDFGIPVGIVREYLKDYSDFIDIAKIGIGTAYITPLLKKKIDLYKRFDINPYFGGTLFEKCYYQKKLDHYFAFLKTNEIEWLEISTGTIDIPLKDRLKIVSTMKDDFHCIAEIGSKDPNKVLSPNEWKEEILSFLEAGCKFVITEGRDSGTSGIYERNGSVKTSILNELLENIDPKKIIFEAPNAKQQMYFINQIGANVNLGNVKLSDVLVLEAERVGLRSETFYLEDQSCILH